MKKYFFLLLICSLHTAVLAQNYEIQGHRGARGLMPENTLEAFKKALDLGVNTLEMDVCISKDGKVVVTHEPYMSAQYMTKPDGLAVTKEEEKTLNLYQMEYREIKKFDSGIRGNATFPMQEKIHTYKPLLADVLKFCEAYIKAKRLKPVLYNIEIKSEEKEYGISQPKTVAEFSDLFYKQVLKYLPVNRIVMQSFDFKVLKFWHQQILTHKYKAIALSALTYEIKAEDALKELGFMPEYYSPYFKTLTKEEITFCHKNNVKVVPWTVNELTDMQQIKALGTDGLITDYPDRAKGL